MEPGYVLQIDGAAKKALSSMRESPSVRTKVRVKNTIAPYDEVVVDAWWSINKGQRFFNTSMDH
jgi:hypothetical protein